MSLPSELDQKFVEVTATDLPLHCPLPSQKLWNTHPRVYLPDRGRRARRAARTAGRCTG